jgi:ATP-dependent Lhr-like helicase
MGIEKSNGYKQVIKWLKLSRKKPFRFQTDAWQHYAEGYCGLVNAPTGFGKTFSLFLAVVIEELNSRAEKTSTASKKRKADTGLKLIWITPLRALAKDLARAMREVCAELELDWQVSVRNGDTTAAEKLKQKKQMPEVLIITPESMHLLLAQKDTAAHFHHLQCIVADE